MGNHLRMTQEELLKKLYYDLKNPAAYAGKSKLLQEAKKIDPKIVNRGCRRVVEISVSIYLTKTGTSQLQNEASLVHRIDEQWQIDLVNMSKLSKRNGRFKFIMVVTDILSR